MVLESIKIFKNQSRTKCAHNIVAYLYLRNIPRNRLHCYCSYYFTLVFS